MRRPTQGGQVGSNCVHQLLVQALAGHCQRALQYVVGVWVLQRWQMWCQQVTFFTQGQDLAGLSGCSASLQAPAPSPSLNGLPACLTVTTAGAPSMLAGHRQGLKDIPRFPSRASSPHDAAVPAGSLLQPHTESGIHLQQARQLRRQHELPDDAFPALRQAWAPQLEALLDHIGAELLLRQVGVVVIQLLHDGGCGLHMPELQDVLHHIVAKRVLQARSGGRQPSALPRSPAMGTPSPQATKLSQGNWAGKRQVSGRTGHAKS